MRAATTAVANSVKICRSREKNFRLIDFQIESVTLLRRQDLLLCTTGFHRSLQFPTTPRSLFDIIRNV